MVTTVTLKELRPKLPEVIERVDGRMDRYIVTRRGKPVAVMMNVDEYESWMETLNLMGDKKTLVRLRRAEQEIGRGNVRPLEEVLQRIETRQTKKR